MASITKTTDFKTYNINIPNISDSQTDNQGTKDILQSFIDQYEEDYLRKTFGTPLYNEFIANFNATNDDNRDEMNDKYKKLWKGFDWERTRIKGTLEGLVHYIAYYYLNSLEFKNTDQGAISTYKEEDAKYFNFEYWNEIWNIASKVNNGMIVYLLDDSDTYQDEDGNLFYLDTTSIDTRSFFNFG